MARRTYPLAYNKWIREQVADWLALPKLYKELPPILSVRNIESAEAGREGGGIAYSSGALDLPRTSRP